MDCKLFERQMQRSIDGLLTQRERQAMLQHAGHCPACAALLQDMTALDAALKAGLRAVEAPQGFAASVMTALPAPYTGQQRRRSFSSRQWLRYAGVAAAAVLLIAAGIFGLFSGGPGSNPLDDLGDPPTIAVVPPNDIIIQPPGPETVEPTIEPDVIIPPENDDPQSNDETVDPDDSAVTQIIEPKPQPPVIIAESDDDDDVDDSNEPYIAAVELPRPAIDGNAPRGEGAFALTLLAAFNDCDAVLPSLNSDGLVEFYMTYKGVHQLWTQALTAESEPEFKEKVKELPSLHTISRSVNESPKTKYPCVSAFSYDNRAKAVNRGGDMPGLWLYEDLASPEAPLKEETAKNITDLAGGTVLSWSADGNKLLFSDAADKLYVYYLHTAPALIVPLYDGAVSCAGWAGDSKKVLFAGKTEKDKHSGIYTIIIP